MTRENQALTYELIDRQLDDGECAVDEYDEYDNAYDITDIDYKQLLYSLYVAVVFTICSCCIHYMQMVTTCSQTQMIMMMIMMMMVVMMMTLFLQG